MHGEYQAWGSIGGGCHPHPCTSQVKKHAHRAPKSRPASSWVMHESKKHTTIAPTPPSTAVDSFSYIYTPPPSIPGTMPEKAPEPQGSRTDHMHSPCLLDTLFSKETLMMMSPHRVLTPRPLLFKFHLQTQHRDIKHDPNKRHLGNSTMTRPRCTRPAHSPIADCYRRTGETYKNNRRTTVATLPLSLLFSSVSPSH